jgi:hypothetical protein
LVEELEKSNGFDALENNGIMIQALFDDICILNQD